jgi:predicted PurR-regulated permease PerM
MEAKTKQEFLSRFWATLFWLALIGILIWAVGKVSTVIGYFALAGTMAYILNPAVELMARRRVPRWLAVLIMFGVAAGIVALALVLILPKVFVQFAHLVNNLPQYFQTLQDIWGRFGRYAKSADLPIDIGSLPEKFAGNLQAAAGKAGKAAFAGIIGFFGTAAGLIVVPILVYYFLSDGPSIHKSFIAAVPPPLKGHTEELMERINGALGGFIRGQLKLCLCMGVMTFLAYLFIIPQYSLVFGLIAGVTEFIPYVGPFLALIGPVVFASFTSWHLVIIVLVIFAVMQVLESNILAPRIIGKDVGLHPALIVFVLMSGGQFGGLVGMIAAIPVAVVLKVLYNYFYVENYLASFKDCSPASGVSNPAEPTKPQPK